MSSLTIVNLPAAPTSYDVHRVEAARYALLRRIAPAMRHHLAGSMQPISMIAAILERRLQAPEPDLTALRESGKSISTQSRSATSAAMNLITWVVPHENSVMPLAAGIDECLGMLSTDLAFRGFNVTNKVGAAELNVSVFSLRTVFTASLIALTDAALAPASIVISSEPAGEQIRVCIKVTSEDGAAPPEQAGSFRQLSWDDVQALAAAEQVNVRHSASHADMLFNEVLQAATV